MSAADPTRRPATAPASQQDARAPAGVPDGAEEETATDVAATEEAADEVSADLDGLLADTKRERDEYLELAQRARADFENYRKRAAREATDAERRGRIAVARELVPALDNLERAVASARSAPDPLAEGIELVLRELRGGLERSGVEAYDPTGESFDPAWHEAVATRPSEGAKPGTVLETLDKGYRLDGQVLRAAKVIVGE